jgi:PKD repeat protein
MNVSTGCPHIRSAAVDQQGVIVPAGQRSERGAAEMVGVLMLIAIFVVAVGVIAVILFSQPPAEKAPAVVLRISNESRLIKLYHDSGDKLPMNDTQIYVYVDGVRAPATFNGVGPNNTWTVGQVLDYSVPPPGMPTKVDVVYTGAQYRGTTGFLIATLLLGNQTSIQSDVTLYTITASAGTGGSIGPSGAVRVASGASQTFDISPDSGYEVLDVVVDGSSVGKPTSYTFFGVTASHTISATFKLNDVKSFSINVTAGDGGTISPGNQTVTFGGGQNYTLSPYTGYLIAGVVVNGTLQTPVRSFYNFTNVTSNQTLLATFSSAYLPGIVGTYYKDRQWMEPGTTLIHPRIRFANGQANYSSDSPTDVGNWPFDYTGLRYNFSVRYSGLLHVEVPDTYNFTVIGCDGYNLSVNDISYLNYMGSPVTGTAAFSTPTSHTTSNVFLNPGYYNFSSYMWDSNTNGVSEQGAIAIYYSNRSKSMALITNFNYTPFVIPVAGFTANPQAGAVPLTVNFTDMSVSATSWQWDFGDGSNLSYAQNPSHTYTLGGTYTVRQTVSNTYGSDIETKLFYITAGAAYSPGLVGTYFNNMTWTAPGVTRIDRRLRLSNTWGGYVYETDQPNWPNSTLSPNAYIGNDNDPLALFSAIWDGYLRVNATDTYFFNLTADDGAFLYIDGATIINNGGIHAPEAQYGSVTLTPGYHHVVVTFYEQYERANIFLQYHNSTSSTYQYVTDLWHIDAPPVAAFTCSPTSGTAPQTVTFTDLSTNSPTSWSWNFGDGNATGATNQNPVHLYTTAGNYSVTLTAINTGGSSTSAAQWVNISPALSGVSFTGTPTSGTVPLTVQFTGTATNSPTAWSWNFGDSGTATVQNPAHTYTVPGNYSVSLTVTNAGGTNSTTRTGYIVTNATIQASAGTGGTISPSGNVNVTYGNSKTFTITPNFGYNITTVTVDGASQGPTSSYTFTNVTTDHTIAATFTLKSYTILASAGTGGTISPSGSVGVTHGSDQPFTITRNAGYHISSVLVDGVSNGTISSYTFTNVTKDHSIAASFAVNTRDYILFDNFEYTPAATLNGWTIGGTVTKGANSQRNGSYNVRLAGAATPASSMTRAISTDGNSSVIVRFAWASSGLDPGESLIAEYSTDGGSSWNSLTSTTATSLTVYSASIAAADDNPNFQLRFRLVANKNNEYGYIDDVWVSGILI